MSNRGPKTRTAQNSTKGFIRHETLDPPSDLTEAAAAEYRRLVEVLSQKGTLDRVDLGILAEAARVKDWLDRAHAAVSGVPTLADVKCIGQLTSQRRGLFRELGLTLQPSRSVVKTNPVGAETVDDPIAGKIKLRSG